ncbi:hypothetical protein B9T29_00800 [Acinetobacter sp. ANC 3903]|uniref:hypothetical protein n=1 Tax=Acinetobacter sp. ANC 3903 TaxID=1977883 RepID=UPI000A357EFD|nr:hypothetical protein [Acinetobacter sp. ANC 3903]OTG64552.1 hypothetical protein B9T29_00800 [Acinetobacter sp. ANC 3903]
MFNRTFKLTTLAIATSLLAACGGGGSSSSTPAAPTINGLAVDGPLAGATVTFTECNNATTTTKSDGTFTFPQGCTSSPVTITGGIDTATDLPFTGEIKAPKRTSNEQNTIVVSPITTLIQASIAAGATPEQATQQIATALNLTGKDLLSIDPMKDQEVYAKTVAVQQMVEQIQTVVASLGGSTTQADLNTVAFSALQAALSTAPASENTLTSTATITAAISATVEAVKEDLPAETAANLANVQTNLAALSAEVIATNVQSVETAIQNVPAATFSQGTESIKTVTQTAVVEAKESIAAEKIVTALAPVLTQAPAQVEESLKAISTAVANPEAPTSGTAITNAITQIETVVPAGTITPTVTDAVQNANSFYTDYLELNGFSVQGTSQPITALNASLINPIQVPSLNNLLVGITSQGTYATTANPIAAAAALHISTGTKTLTISANKLNLNFSAGTLTAATIPAGTEIKVDSTINSLKTTFTVNAEQNVLSNGKIALNTTTLGSLSASLATQLNSFSLKGDTVTVTAVIKATPVIAINNGNPAVAPKYTLGTTDGFGLSAKFKVTQ